jgi:hypothetical protein
MKKLQVIRIGKQNTKLDFMSSQTYYFLFSPAMYWERAPDGNEKRPYKKKLRKSSERVITICSDTVTFLDGGEIHEM